MHFAYCRPEEGTGKELQQGDILKIDGTLRTIIEKHHPHYAKKTDYRYLMVLTQSCDLVRRKDNQCKSRYITLAAVRSFETAMQRELAKHQLSNLEKLNNLCSKEKRHFVRDFLNKLINNNYPGYYYLAIEPELGIYEEYVAFLSLSITIKAECYDTCIEQRLAQLAPVFQAKLGWLVGNEYSKVGTPDWVPERMTEDRFEEMIEDILDRSTLWAPQSVIQMVKDRRKKQRKIRGDKKYQMPVEEVLELISQFARQEQEKKQLLVQFMVEKIKSFTSGITAQQEITLNYELQNSPELERLIS